MIPPAVLLFFHLIQTTRRHIHFTTEYRFEQTFPSRHQLHASRGQLVGNRRKLRLRLRHEIRLSRYRLVIRFCPPSQFIGFFLLLFLPVHPFFQGRILTVLQQGDTLLPHFDVRIRTAVLFGRIIKKLLDGHHVTMIGDGHSAHTVFHRLVNQARHAGLTVEDGILSMHMKMYEVLHNSYNLVKQKLRAKVTPH